MLGTSKSNDLENRNDTFCLVDGEFKQGYNLCEPTLAISYDVCS